MHEMTRHKSERRESGGGGGNHLGHLQSSCISELKMVEIAQTQSGRLISFSEEVGGKKS